MQYAVNHDCLQCGAKGGIWTGGCLGCAARKIVYLRSPDHRLSRKMQSAILDPMQAQAREAVLSFVADYDRGTLPHRG